MKKKIVYVIAVLIISLTTACGNPKLKNGEEVVAEIEGKKIYHAGDTCLNYEMKTIGEVYSPEISLLPIGGYYTMDVEQATIASEWLNTRSVIPMHYNTFDAIKVDINLFESEMKNINKNPVILKIGCTLSL